MPSDTEERPRKRLVNIVPALAYVLAVFVVGSLPSDDLGTPLFVGWDKVVHLVVFAGMFLIVLRALMHELPRVKVSSKLLVALAITSALGALLEVHQLAVPGRSAELLDWASDTLGALLAAFAVRRLVPGFGRQASTGG